ncbi:MAG: nuclear transport factor 2 family protein [Cyanobacteria bacterium P01_F01_bin.150]
MSQAHTVVQSIYDAINRRDIAGAIAHVDEDCLYEDLNFPSPFKGKAAVEELFTKSCSGIPDDLLFIIDDITTGDAQSVGILWHVELGGIPFPNGRGASFCKISDTTGKLIFARDLVEPPFKPGHISFFLIRLVTPIVRRFMASRPSPPVSPSPPSPLLPLLFWAIALTYTYVLLLSPSNQLLPGDPAWAIQPETLQEVLDESLNFFLILPIVNYLGITFMQAPVVHPATEGFFNLAEAWAFMFLPLLLLDQRGRSLPRIPIWGMAMFLTNVFLTPYMALRSKQSREVPAQSPEKTLLARVFGWTGLVVGTGAIAWFCLARPEFGGLFDRYQYFLGQLTTNRVTIAFCVDLVLFYIFQILLMGAIEAKNGAGRSLRFIPFWGLALWLIL